MKKLFTALFGFVLLVLGTPALLATIMYDGSGDTHMPTHLYTEDADAQQMLMEELRDSFDELEEGVTEDMIFNLNEDIINVAIFQAIRDENPEYMPTDDCSTPEQCYVVAEQQTFEDFNIMMRVVGAWVEFEQDIFTLNVFLEVELEDGFTYKTVITTEFKFTDVPGKYVLEFEEIRIGNLPVPASMISGIMSIIEDNADNVDFNSMVQDVEVGEIDINEFTFTVQKDEIVEMIGEGEEQSAENDLVKEVLSIVFEQELLTFELEKDEFVLSARLSKFQSEDITDIPDYLYDLHSVDPVTDVVGDYDETALDPESYLTDLFTEYVFNYALIGGGFEINEETFNKLIYAGAGGFADARQVQTLDLGDGETEEIEIGLKAIWFEIEPDAIYANALLRVASVDSLLTLRADKVDAESSSTELVFEFNEITFGKDTGETNSEYLEIVDLAVFQQLFADLGDVEFGVFDEFGVLHISAERLSTLMQDGSEDGAINVTGISIIQDALVLDITPANQDLADALDDFSAAIEEVMSNTQLLTDLEGLLDTDTEGPEQEVFEAVQDLQTTLLDGDTPDPEQVELLFENFEEMDEESQQDFLEAFEGLIDGEVFTNFEDYFGNVTEDAIPE